MNKHRTHMGGTTNSPMISYGTIENASNMGQAKQYIYGWEYTYIYLHM